MHPSFEERVITGAHTHPSNSGRDAGSVGENSTYWRVHEPLQDGPTTDGSTPSGLILRLANIPFWQQQCSK